MAKDKLALERTFKKTASYPVVFMITGQVVTAVGTVLEVAKVNGDEFVKVGFAAGICVIFLFLVYG